MNSNWVVNALSTSSALAAGLFTGISFVNKYGVNPKISTNTTPEDICGAGGLYTGFPTGTPETVTLVSSSENDTSAGSGARKVVVLGLDANCNSISEEITLNGTTPVTSTNAFRRIHSAYVSESGSSNQAFNEGSITCAYSVTTSVVFFVMQIARNQTNESAYTVPAGYTAYVRRLHGYVRNGRTNSANIAIYIREPARAPRLRRPTDLVAAEFDDNIFGGLLVPEKSDISIRCTTVSANGLEVAAGYDLLLVKN